jgi:hypothetical protein
MKTEGLVHLGFDSNIDTDTRASLDILVRRVLDISDDIFDFHIWLSHPYFATDEILEIINGDELTVDFYKIRRGISSYVEKYAHLYLSSQSIIYYFTISYADQKQPHRFLKAW